MAKRDTGIPITTEVLRWAIAESGFSEDEVARAAGLSESQLAECLRGTGAPNLTQLRRLASKLRRPLATFLLPQVPKTARKNVQFRHPPTLGKRELNPTERRYIRHATRVQTVLSWLADELQYTSPRLPSLELRQDPVEAGSKTRALLRIPVSTQTSWPSASAALDRWREALEARGIAVFLFPLGQKSCRGFSLWDERVPVLAVSTAWRQEARVFTLFHELGHLVTRTNSACLENGHSTLSTGTAYDPAERWCERFAAAALMPKEAVYSFLPDRRGQVSDLHEAGRIARAFKVSLRAATIRLIEIQLASWELYRQIPKGSDEKGAGRGGTGRNIRQIREDELGRLATSIFRRAVDADVVTRSQALDYLDIPDSEFDRLEARP